MKIAIVSPDARGHRDGTVQLALLNHLPNQVVSQNDADVLIVPMSYMEGYQFNEGLIQITKPWILLDYTEYGWDADDKNNLWGTGSAQHFNHLNTEAYKTFDILVKANPPILEFKRELLRWNQDERRLPCEFPCRMELPEIQSKGDFDARPLEVFFNWGLSHPSRPKLHGEIFIGSQIFGYHVIDNFEHHDRFEKRTWATIHTPWYARRGMTEVMTWNQRAKISVSMPGAGVKCFRSTMEAPVGSIVAMPEDKLSWSFPWVHGENCLRDCSPIGLHVAQDRNLYEIYLACQETVSKYRSERYVREYIMPNIEKVL